MIKFLEQLNKIAEEEPKIGSLIGTIILFIIMCILMIISAIFN